MSILFFTVEASVPVLAGLCMLVCVANIAHLLCRRTLASPMALSPAQTLWGILGFLCAVTCAISFFASLGTDGFNRKSRIVTASLWVIVSLFRALYLAPTPCRSLLLKNATFLSLSIYLTVDVPRRLYPMIWLQVPTGPRLSSLDIVQLVASSACSVLLPILSPNSNTSVKGVYHPTDRCSPLSRWWFYTWVSPLVTLGYERNGSINKEDLHPLRNEASVETWQQAYASCCPESLPFKVILWKLFRMRLATMTLFAGLCGFFELLGTVGLHQLLLFLQSPYEAKLQPWFCITLFAVSPIIRGICMQTFEYLATHTIGDWKSLIVAAVYQKMTMLETDADINVGQLQSIISVDIDRLGTLRYTAMTAFMVPVEFITASILLYRVMGWYYIPSLLFLLVTRYPLSRFIISEQTRAQSAIVRATDSRITRTSESIRALLMIKILGNAQSFIRRILDERKPELDAIWLKMRVIILSESLSSSCSFLAMVLSLCLFIFAGKKALAPDIVFTLVAVFNIIKSMLTLSVLGAGQYAQAMVSLQRLSDFMDRKASPVVTDKTQPTMQPQTLDPRTPSLSREQVLGEFNDTQASLDVEFLRGGLNVITGDTGSGKTLLLHSLLLGGFGKQGSVALGKGQFEPIAYASQEPWLFRGSIKDNIVFGTAYDQKRYERVIRDCELEKDLAAFKDGDLKEVGEGGRSLSGGQRQRVSLARAMYTNANVVILDDILSGLDPSTFEWVVTKCIFRSEQRNRTMILVTNSQRLLQMADLVIHMENGRITQVKKNLGAKNTQSVPDTSCVDCLLHDRPEASETISATFGSTDGSDETSPVSAETFNECADLQRVSSLRYGFKYLRSFGSRPFVTLAVISAVGAQALEIGLPAWLAIWSAISMRNEEEGRDSFYLGIYTGLGSAQIAILAISLLLLYSGAWRSSRDKHMEMISAIFGTTYSWIWSTPVGQVINRFSTDIASLDDTLFRTFRPVLETYLSIGLRILTVTSLIPLFFLPSVMLCGCAIYVGYRYRFAATAVKHLYAASLTPLHHSIAETASGLKTIRAFRAEGMLQKRFNAAVEHHVQAWNALSDLQRWLAVRMDVFVGLISCSAATLAILRPNSSAAVVGLSLTLTTGLCTALLYLVYLSSLLEVEMASYCRIENYIQELPQEVSSADLEAYIVEEWPDRGLISFENFGASYALDEDEILKGINYRANAGQRTAIVGRTGSGKTSLALSMLRLTTRTRGSISIDGVDIEWVPVEKLRQSISFIPQDPTLLDGTIRFNLDFNGEYEEGYLQSVLDDVAGTRKWKLDDIVELNGRNFSQGERQLITLARAMVSKHKILIIDEGTASLDKASENRIMAVLRDRFSECTVIAITHRLHSIVDFDQVLVMGDGQVLEGGNPRHLLEGGESLFKALYLQQCGTDRQS